MKPQSEANKNSGRGPRSRVADSYLPPTSSLGCSEETMITSQDSTLFKQWLTRPEWPGRSMTSEGE